MKNLIAITSLVGLMAVSTSAQKIETPLNGGTNRVSGGTSNLYNIAIPVPKAAVVAVQFSFRMVSAGATSNCWFYLDASADNVTWSRNAHTLGVAANGTSTVGVITNLTVGAMPFLRLGTIYNTNTVAATNVTLVVASKTGVRGIGL